MVIKKLIILAVILCLCLAAVSCPNTENGSREWRPPAEDYQPGSAMEFVASMKIGWNLGNTLDAHNGLRPSETAWGNPRAAQSLMDAVADYGFGAVRIPVTWGTMVGSAPDYIINPIWLNRVAEVVEYARLAGLKSIINIHHDGADSSHWLSVRTDALTGAKKDAIDAQFTAMWRQIAEKFKDEDNYLVFEGFNELHDGSWGNGSPAQRSRVNELNQLFVNAVRAAGGKNSDRFLVISGWVTRPSLLIDVRNNMPTDTAADRLIVNFHYYDPYDFTISADRNTWTDTWAGENHIRNTFNNVRNWFPDIPVIIGEIGEVRHPSAVGKAQRRYYTEYSTKLAKDLGFVIFYWDNGGRNLGSEGFGIINRSSPHAPFNDDAKEVINLMMKAVNEDYLLSDIKRP